MTPQSRANLFITHLGLTMAKATEDFQITLNSEVKDSTVFIKEMDFKLTALIQAENNFKRFDDILKSQPQAESDGTASGDSQESSTDVVTT